MAIPSWNSGMKILLDYFRNRSDSSNDIQGYDGLKLINFSLTRSMTTSCKTACKILFNGRHYNTSNYYTVNHIRDFVFNLLSSPDSMSDEQIKEYIISHKIASLHLFELLPFHARFKKIFPEVKFLFHERDYDSWVRSFETNMIQPRRYFAVFPFKQILSIIGAKHKQEIVLEFRKILLQKYKLPHYSDVELENAKSFHGGWTKAVLNENIPDILITYYDTIYDWKLLCGHLNVGIPPKEIAYPHINQTLVYSSKASKKEERRVNLTMVVKLILFFLFTNLLGIYLYYR